MKKVYSLIGAALLASTIAGGNAYASENINTANEEYQFNWDEAWANVEKDPNYYPNSVGFEGTVSDNPSGIQTQSFDEYARGTTALRYANLYVYSKGITYGESLWTTTSAYTGIKNTDQSNIVTYGKKGTAVAYMNAESEAKRKYMPLDANFFIGMTVHTATMNGAIYEKATSDSGWF
ncbi:hypothetical protein RCG19_21035 [Neobacillus sp. OS1-2]|uniref:hypothetical protein n=1 Tax=Neobacillus sp. OS1-2 TaxID=3070680 RepID=UPI0027E18254|nr:hypothetical protein [Neobacillus sp. OS1-2]WML39629.1 hypothetical protein RCG19_21035 [Neobacillus sp. OS1-2]